MKMALFLDNIGRYETFSEHGFQAGSCVFTTDTRMKLHKIEKANRRITNDEGWNRFAKSFLKQIEYSHSTFDVHQFFFRLDWPLFRPAAALIRLGACVQFSCNPTTVKESQPFFQAE